VHLTNSKNPFTSQRNVNLKPEPKTRVIEPLTKLIG